MSGSREAACEAGGALVIPALRRSLPTAPPKPARRWGGRLRASPPTDDPTDPSSQRWQLRQATRQAGIAQVHGLARQGLSHRARARHLGIDRRTVKVFLALDPSRGVPDELAHDWHDRILPTADTMRRHIRQAKHVQVRELAEQGHSSSAIARRVGIDRVRASKWLKQAVPDDRSQGPLAPPESTTDAETPAALLAPQPPLPWQQWDEVRVVREAVQEQR